MEYTSSSQEFTNQSKAYLEQDKKPLQWNPQRKLICYYKCKKRLKNMIILEKLNKQASKDL